MISDLHLGAHRGTDVLRRSGPLEALCAHLDGFDRLVILGDGIELRHGPARDALAVAEPVFNALGKALGRKGELILVSGNHDHGLVAPWLRERGAEQEPEPLRLEERPGRKASGLTRRLAEAASPAKLDVAFPGVWLREDVYATHGHYLDCLTTIPAFERLGAGVMARIVGALPEAAARPDDFEALLSPMYAWLDAIAESRGGRWASARQGSSASAWELLSSSSARRPLKARALIAIFPLGIRGLNRAGIGPLQSNLSGHALRHAALTAMSEVVLRLQIDAEHVLFGHTHRAGPLESDPEAEWLVPGTATHLHNPGCWIDEPIFARGDTTGPYWAGRGIEVDDEGPPRLVRIVTDLGQAPSRA